MTATRIPILTLPLVLAALLAGCGDGTQTGSRVGELAPDFELERIDGGTLKLSDLRGKAVLIDFWDTWCPPCREAMPHLQELSVEYADEAEVVGVAFGRDGRDAVAKFVRKHGLTFPVVLIDSEFRTARDFGDIQSIPTTVLVDREGVIRQVWQGGQPKQEYARGLRRVLDA